MGDKQTEQKRQAAEAAVALVQDGMVVGLGTGSTAAFLVDGLARRVREGLRISGIPTSEHTAAQARAGGITLTTFAEHPQLDIDIDGADEIATGTLDLIKGLGGALLREKIVAAAAARLVIVADETKLVERLGSRAPVPVEVVAFGWETTAARLRRLGAETRLRTDGKGLPFRTDSGNFIVDCGFGTIAEPRALEVALSAVIGVVETGLFIGMADRALVATSAGVREIRRARD